MSITPWANSPPASSKISSHARRLAQATPSGSKPALEAVGRIAVQAQLAGGGADRQGIEFGGFEQDVGRAGSDFGFGSAHHAPQADRPLGVGNHAHAGLERVGFVVDGHEGFALACLADHDSPAVQAGQIERVQRLAAFHQHIVRHVDDVVDRRDADRRQPLDHPGRARPDLHAPNHAGGIAVAKLGRFERDLRQIGHLGRAFVRVGRRQREGPIPKDRDFAGDADMAQAVGPIAGDFQVDRPIGAVRSVAS